MKKTLFTLFLALAASVGTLFAESGTCGDDITWTYSNGILSISGSGDMTNYSSDSDNRAPWYVKNLTITTVIINEGVTSIGDMAFCYCNRLSSITISNSITSIGNGALAYCLDLTSLTLGNNVTSIGDYAFQDCHGLASVTIPNSVTSIGGGAFYGCTGLTSITIPNRVTSIGNYAFYGCSSLTSIAIPNSVTTIGEDAFRNCSGLTSIAIPNSVTTIGEDAFYKCTGLTSIEIPNSVTSIEDQTFYGCTGLTSIKIPNSVTSIGISAFYGCTGLTSIEIPNKITSIGMDAFCGCSSLTSLHISDVAAWCNISFKNRYANPIYYTNLLYLNDTKITDLVIPNGVTSIEDFAFINCDNLKSVTIPNSVTRIGAGAFLNCSGLTSITIPSSVEKIGDNAFSNCLGLNSVTCFPSIPPTSGRYGPWNIYDYYYGQIPLYVPKGSIEAYNNITEWRENFHIYPISAKETETIGLQTTPTNNSVDVTWKAVAKAVSYVLIIKDTRGNKICTLIFNANGQLMSLVFHAPARNNVTQHQQEAGFSFTVTGLNAGTAYDLSITAKDSNDTPLDVQTKSFTTTGTPTALDQTNEEMRKCENAKILRDGQIYILLGDKTYTLQGQEVQ